PFGTPPRRGGAIGGGGTFPPSNVRAQAYLDEALGWLSDGTASEDLPPPSASEDLGNIPSMPKADGQLVLLADDNADMRNYVQPLLSTAGFQVETATDGQQALAMARRLRPDLVLSDVMMPELDGFGLLKALRA